MQEPFIRVVQASPACGHAGLMISAFAATMSTLSGDYNVRANVLTHDVYRRLRVPAHPSGIGIGGILMTLLVGLLALGAALLMAYQRKRRTRSISW